MRAGTSLSLISWCDRMLTIARASGSSEVGTLGGATRPLLHKPSLPSLFERLFPAFQVSPSPTHVLHRSRADAAVVYSASSGATDSRRKEREKVSKMVQA